MQNFRRGSFLASLASFSVTPSLARAADMLSMPAPETAAREVREAFLHAWNAYRRFAWGKDEVHPVSGTGSNFFIKEHSFGLSIIEALDTLYIMGLDDELHASVEWLRKNLNFDVDGEVQMFEANIRMVAGLITGYYATGQRFLLDGARDLADRLLPCFTKSPTGAPYRFVNLRTGAVRDPKTNLAEIGTNVLEFGDLTRLTNDPKYREASMRAYRAVMPHRSAIGLLGTYFDVEKNEFFETEDVAPDEPVDSFYEYLWGGWQVHGEEELREWYRSLTSAILKYHVTHANGHLWFQNVNYLTGKPTGDSTISELAAFYAELVSKGGNRDVGEAFYDSWTAVAQKYQLIPEEIDFKTLAATDAQYNFRPEYANSAFDLWFLTHDEKYRRTAYTHFDAVRTHCKVASGYTTVKDIRTTPMTLGDHFPAYSFSENFKYLYCIFAGSTDRFDGSTYYLNTEGKPLRGLLRNGKPAHLT